MKKRMILLMGWLCYTAFSFGLLLFFNWLGGPAKLSVNFASVATSAVLGVPRVAALLFLRLFYQ